VREHLEDLKQRAEHNASHRRAGQSRAGAAERSDSETGRPGSGDKNRNQAGRGPS
jgi:hypothetical protein